MVMRMALARADVDGPAGEQWKGIYVETRGTTLTLRERQGGPLVEIDASAVRRLPNRTFEIDTSQGTFVVKRQPCSCHGG